MSELPATNRKALELNMDPVSYGSFAEIGAGQEVVRWFFQAGGAARTVAKSISAYDMAVSDALYGAAKRYVSRQRLEAMLDHEYQQLVDNLGPTRGERSAFFVFADTVATRRRDHAEHGRGWVGVRFQARPKEPPSTILVHAHLLDRTPVGEQRALGILGVNLIYAAFFMRSDVCKLLGSLMDDLSRERIELDMVKLSGPAFAGVDNRIVSLQLLAERLTDAAMFTAAGEVVQPSEVLYKRPILVERGSFRPATKLTVDLLERARDAFLAEPEVHGAEPVVLAEMTLRSLTSDQDHQVGLDDFLARVEILHVLGIDVLVSRFQPFYQLADYLAAYTDQLIGIAVGLPTLRDLLDEQYYQKLDGGALEAIGRLFKRSVRVYVYPTRDPATGRVVTLLDTPTQQAGLHLRNLLMAFERLKPIDPSDTSLLSIRTPEVFRRLRAGDPDWTSMVPPAVAARIEADGLFGIRTSRAMDLDDQGREHHV